MSFLRVGGVVYDDDRKVHAIFQHGAWYRQVFKSEELVELIPLEHAQAKACDRLPDSLTIAFSGGELAIMSAAEACIGNPKMGGRNLRSLVDAIHHGVARGLRKYGPFRAEDESRDLEGEVLRCLRNAIVFGSMCVVRDRDRADVREIKEIVAVCGRLWINTHLHRKRRR